MKPGDLRLQPLPTCRFNKLNGLAQRFARNYEKHGPVGAVLFPLSGDPRTKIEGKKSARLTQRG